MYKFKLREGWFEALMMPLVARPGTSTSTRTVPGAGRTRGRSARCTGAGWSTSKPWRSRTVWSDTAGGRAWTPGTSQMVRSHCPCLRGSGFICLETLFPAYLDEYGVWTHALDNSDVAWFSYRGCSQTPEQDGSWGGDYWT